MDFPWLRKGLNLLAGRSGAGKSHLMMQLACEEMADLKVCYISLERFLEDHLWLLSKFGRPKVGPYWAELRNVRLVNAQSWWYHKYGGNGLTDLGRAQAMDKWLKKDYSLMEWMNAEMGGCDVPFTDPGTLLPNSDNHNNAGQMAHFFWVWRQFFASRQAAMMSWHFNKLDPRKAGSLVDRIQGSAQIVANTDTVLCLSTEADEREAPRLHVKLQKEPGAVYQLERLESGLWEVLGKVEGGDPREAALAALSLGSASRKELLDAMGCPTATGDRALARLVAEGLVRKEGRGSYSLVVS